jgi:uncharacterized protein YggE
MNDPIQKRTMTLTGRGQVTLIPDLAVIRLGVELSGPDLEEVQSQNAKQSQGLLEALTMMGISDVNTFQYSIDKHFENVNDIPLESGYTVRNIYEIRINDTEKIGTVIDAAVNAGANAVDFISFEVSDPERYYLQALNLAVAEAIGKAKSIADELDIPFDPIPISITEVSSMPMSAMPFQREAATTPIIPGNITIEANIIAEFAY